MAVDQIMASEQFVLDEINNIPPPPTTIDWLNINNKPSSFTPSNHNQEANTINAMTGYSKGTSTAAISATDTLNQAIAKLENKVVFDVHYCTGSGDNTTICNTITTFLNTNDNKKLLMLKIIGTAGASSNIYSGTTSETDPPARFYINNPNTYEKKVILDFSLCTLPTLSYSGSMTWAGGVMFRLGNYITVLNAEVSLGGTRPSYIGACYETRAENVKVNAACSYETGGSSIFTKLHAFDKCDGVINCSVSGQLANNYSEGYTFAYAFYKCKNLRDCDVNNFFFGSTVGRGCYAECDVLWNCTGDVEGFGESSALFTNCTNLVICKAWIRHIQTMPIPSSSARQGILIGFNSCKGLTNCYSFTEQKRPGVVTIGSGGDCYAYSTCEDLVNCEGIAIASVYVQQSTGVNNYYGNGIAFHNCKRITNGKGRGYKAKDRVNFDGALNVNTKRGLAYYWSSDVSNVATMVNCESGLEPLVGYLQDNSIVLDGTTSGAKYSVHNNTIFLPVLKHSLSGQNYFEGNNIVDVDFEKCSWEQFEYMLEKGTAQTIFPVGTTKSVSLGTYGTYTMQIYDYNHDDLTSGGKAKATIGFFNGNSSLMPSSYYKAMKATDDNTGGISATDVHTFLQQVLLAMPADLQAVIKNVDKKVSAGNSSTSLLTTSCKLFLLSGEEVGLTTGIVVGEGTQYPIFTDNNSRIKRGNGSSARIWWLRSPHNANATQYRAVSTSGTSAVYNASTATNSICFAFCI